MMIRSTINIKMTVSSFLFYQSMVLSFLVHLAVAIQLFFFFFCLFLSFFAISWDTPVAYGGSQARGLIGAVAAGLRQSHSNTRSKPYLRPTPHTAHGNARSLTHWMRPGIKPEFSWILVRFVTAEPQWELPWCVFLFLCQCHAVWMTVAL